MHYMKSDIFGINGAIITPIISLYLYGNIYENIFICIIYNLWLLTNAAMLGFVFEISLYALLYGLLFNLYILIVGISHCLQLLVGKIKLYMSQTLIRICDIY